MQSNLMEGGAAKFGYSHDTWNTAKEEAQMAVSDRAKLGKTISYSELCGAVKSINFEPDSYALRILLGEISTEEDQFGRGMLTVLVVHKTGDQMPGNGFFELAAKLGRNVSNREALWIQEFNKVCSAWGYDA